jgi:hypothetical protein
MKGDAFQPYFFHSSASVRAGRYTRGIEFSGTYLHGEWGGEIARCAR